MHASTSPACGPKTITHVPLFRQVNSKWSTACRSWSYTAAVAQDLRTFWPRQVYKNFAMDCVSIVWQVLSTFFVVQALRQFRHALRKRDPISDMKLCNKNFCLELLEFWDSIYSIFIMVDRYYISTVLEVLFVNENRFCPWNQIIPNYYWIFQIMPIKTSHQRYINRNWKHLRRVEKYTQT